MLVTEKERVELIKWAIKTEEGWQSLARSIKSKEDKDFCIGLLTKLSENSNLTNPTFTESLIQKLNYNISLIEVTEK